MLDQSIEQRPCTKTRCDIDGQDQRIGRYHRWSHRLQLDPEPSERSGCHRSGGHVRSVVETGGEDGIKSILSPHQRAMLAKLRETPFSPSRIFTRCGADWVRWVSEWRGNALVGCGERERCGRWAARWAGARFAAWLCPFPLSLAGRLAGSAGWLAGVLRIDTGLVACTNRFRRFQGSISSDSSFDICPSW